MFQVPVKAILPNSQAEKLGIQPSDILLRYNHKPILGMSGFIYGRSLEPGTNPETELAVLRNGKELVFKLKPEKFRCGTARKFSKTLKGDGASLQIVIVNFNTLIPSAL